MGCFWRARGWLSGLVVRLGRSRRGAPMPHTTSTEDMRFTSFSIAVVVGKRPNCLGLWQRRPSDRAAWPPHFGVGTHLPIQKV